MIIDQRPFKAEDACIKTTPKWRAQRTETSAAQATARSREKDPELKPTGITPMETKPLAIPAADEDDIELAQLEVEANELGTVSAGVDSE